MIKLRIEGVYSHDLTHDDTSKDLPVDLLSGIGLEFEYPEPPKEVKLSIPVMYNSERNRFYLHSQEQHMAELYSCVGDLGGSLGRFETTVNVHGGVVEHKLKWDILRGPEYERSMTHGLSLALHIDATRKEPT